MPAPQGNQLPVQRAERMVPAPRHGLAVLRLGGAGQAQLVPVKHAGHARKGHLKHHGLPHARLVPAALGQKAAHVVAVQQIELGEHGGLPVAGEQPVQPHGQPARIKGAPGEELQGQAPEIVIHAGIQHVALQKVRRVLPHLADEERVGLCGLDRGAEGPQKAVVDLVGHIQPPAVYIKGFDPVAAYFAEVGARLRTGQVRLGHVRHIGKARVFGQLSLRREAGMLRQVVEPAVVAGLPAPGQHVLKEGMAAAHMVEHAVEDHAHAAGVRGMHQLPEVLAGAEAGVHTEVVQRVVLVIAAGGKDGVEVETVASQTFDGVQIFADAAERAAQQRAAGFAAEGGTLGLLRQTACAACEAVGEDVVDHRVRGPIRHRQAVGAVVVGELKPVRAVRLRRGLKQAADVVGGPGAVAELKVVGDAVELRGQTKLEPVRQRVRIPLFHGGAPVAQRPHGGPVGIPQGAAGQVARLRAQAEHVVRIVQRKGVLAGRPVPYRGVIHAITLSPSRRPRRRHNTFADG